MWVHVDNRILSANMCKPGVQNDPLERAGEEKNRAKKRGRREVNRAEKARLFSGPFYDAVISGGLKGRIT